VVFITKDIIMNKKRLKEDIDKTIKLMGLNLIVEQEHGGTVRSSGGGTSTSSSGQYISTGAWGENPFNGNGREEDIGDLPSEVDITGGSVAGFEAILKLLGDPEDPHGDDKGPRGDGEGPGGPRGGDDDDGSSSDDGDYDPNPHNDRKDKTEPGDYTTKMNDTPCCEPCGNGMWKRCNTDDCVYSTISDCELRGNNNTYSESKKSRTTFND
tara:strand:- start:2214 stop:2846 length:633 start_codon:yes stop_codon:yes gene_type:complete